MASMVAIIVGYSSSIPLPKKTQPHKFAGKCMVNYTQAAKIFSKKKKRFWDSLSYSTHQKKSEQTRGNLITKPWSHPI